MPPVDAPLKMLILAFSRVFVEWLLGGPVHHVQPLNVELPASTSRSDLIFDVVQADGQRVLLHLEQQGRRSSRPMAWRMLEYMSRLSVRELGEESPTDTVRLQSIVIYTGVGAGVNDRGSYELLDGAGASSLKWSYRVVLLWQMEAEEVLKLREPAFLPLVGQMQVREPERVLPEVIARIRQVVDEEERGRLLTALASLMSSEEALEMVEKMLDAGEEELLDTPYLRRIRQQGRAEGLVEGKQAGLDEGVAKGKEEGLAEGVAKGKEEGLVEGVARGKEEGLAEGVARGKAEGMIEGLREAILEAITVRFDPVASEYRRVSHHLAGVTRRERLQQLLTVAIQAKEMSSFVAHLDDSPADE